MQIHHAVCTWVLRLKRKGRSTIQCEMTSSDITCSELLRKLEMLQSETLPKSCRDHRFLRISLSPQDRCADGCCLVAVMIALEGPIDSHADVVGLLLGKCRQIGTQRRQMQLRNLLIQLLGQQVYIVLVGLCLLPVLQEVQLRKHLIREGTRHHERRMPGSTAPH